MWVRHHQPTVQIPDELLPATWSAMRRLPDPPSLPGLDRDEVLPPPLVRSLHFIDDGKMLVVAYLDHGFVSAASLISCHVALTPHNLSSCWNVNSLEMSWHLVPRTCCMYVHGPLTSDSADEFYSGRSTISLDQKTLVVSNLYDGLDWYNIPDRAFSRAVPIRITRNKPLPVLFIDDGDAIIIGGSSGEVRILDSRTAETLQTLEHDRKFFYHWYHTMNCRVTASDSGRSHTGFGMGLWRLNLPRTTD